MTEIQSATIQETYRAAPAERLVELEWPRTGERLNRESFERYGRIGGPVVVHTNTEQMVAVAINSPLTIIASDAYWQNGTGHPRPSRSEEHTSELQSHSDLVCRLLLEKKKA